MQKLNLPEYGFKFKQDGERIFVFDDIRKKNIVLTPEEWVRQHWIRYLQEAFKVPFSMMAVEKGMKLNNLQKRFDLLVYGKNGSPVLLAEFKAPGISIGQAVFDQAARYNFVFRVPYLLISNGLEHYFVKTDFENNSYEFLEALPDYPAMNMQ